MNQHAQNPLSRQLPQEDELDRNLSRILDGDGGSETLVPSAGFPARVMESIRESNVTQPPPPFPPLPFPWKLALPAFGCAFAILLYAVLRFAAEVRRLPSAEGPAATVHLPVVFSSVFPGILGPLGWIALALLVAFVSVRLCLRLGGRTT